MLISYKKKFGKIEQKTAEWHREDEQNLNACLGFIPDEFLRRWLTDAIHAKYDNHTWSEEDEIAFGDALWCCKQAASIAKDENEMGNAWYAERWLKALKDRYTWRPSDEQMITLRHVISGCSYDIEPLVELETKLKEL